MGVMDSGKFAGSSAALLYNLIFILACMYRIPKDAGATARNRFEAGWVASILWGRRYQGGHDEALSSRQLLFALTNRDSPVHLAGRFLSSSSHIGSAPGAARAQLGEYSNPAGATRNGGGVTRSHMYHRIKTRFHPDIQYVI